MIAQRTSTSDSGYAIIHFTENGSTKEVAHTQSTLNDKVEIKKNEIRKAAISSGKKPDILLILTNDGTGYQIVTGKSNDQLIKLLYTSRPDFNLDKREERDGQKVTVRERVGSKNELTTRIEEEIFFANKKETMLCDVITLDNIEKIEIALLKTFRTSVFSSILGKIGTVGYTKEILMQDLKAQGFTTVGDVIDFLAKKIFFNPTEAQA